MFIFANRNNISMLSRKHKAGKLRKIHSGIYTDDLQTDLKTQTIRHVHQIINHLFKGGVVSHKSAFDFGATRETEIIISFKYNRPLEINGITFRVLRAPPPLADDIRFMDFFISSRHRAFLENLTSDRLSHNGSHKNVAFSETRKRLHGIFLAQGIAGLSDLGDKAKAVCVSLGMEKEYIKLSDLIESLSKNKTFSDRYDEHVVLQMETLLRDMLQFDFPSIVFDKNQPGTQGFENRAFLESYFTNYIEGTEFGIDVAQKIVFTYAGEHKRHADGHDVYKTYLAVSGSDLSRTPRGLDDFISLIKDRHLLIMGHREDKTPGQFKTILNRAGGHYFVDLELMAGTFKKCFEMYQSIPDCKNKAFVRGIFISTAFVMVHPFLDGNGRISRILLNAELSRDGQMRTIIPTVFRDDYILALRAFSQKTETYPLLSMFSRAYKQTAQIPFELDFSDLKTFLMKTNAMLDPKEAKWINLDNVNFYSGDYTL